MQSPRQDHTAAVWPCFLEETWLIWLHSQLNCLSFFVDFSISRFPQHLASRWLIIFQWWRDTWQFVFKGAGVLHVSETWRFEVNKERQWALMQRSVSALSASCPPQTDLVQSTSFILQRRKYSKPVSCEFLGWLNFQFIPYSVPWKLAFGIHLVSVNCYC